VVDFYNFNGDDKFIFYYASFWFKIYRTILNLLGETLSLDDFVSKYETTQTGESRVINETDPSTRCHRRHG